MNALMVVSPQPLPAQVTSADPSHRYEGHALAPPAGPTDARGYTLYGQPYIAGQRTDYSH